MQTKSARKSSKRKNSRLIVKNVSGRVNSELHAPIKGQVKADSKTGLAKSKCSAILIVETKNERMRTIREYEKQRDILRNVIARW